MNLETEQMHQLLYFRTHWHFASEHIDKPQADLFK
jgi:hypothetical protein